MTYLLTPLQRSDLCIKANGEFTKINKVNGAASEGYKNKEACIKNAEHYGYNDKFNNAGTWEMYQDKKEEWCWRHTTANGEIIGSSMQGYQHKQDCIDNAKINGYVA